MSVLRGSAPGRRKHAHARRAVCRAANLKLELLEQRRLLAGDGLCGEIRGLKWEDINGNGVRELGEPGIAGITIYADVNGNSALDDNEPRAVTLADDPNTTEDETGSYRIADAPVGQYIIREVVPEGFKATFPFDAPHAVIIADGTIIDGIDFGNRDLQQTTVRGVKWSDRNANGMRELGEPGVPGVVIYSDLNNNGALDLDEPQTETLGDGTYWLQGLEQGTHFIREIVPPTFEQTFPVDGFHKIVVNVGQLTEGIDFGNAPPPATGIHGVKWFDRDGNGIREPDEPGIPGVTIYDDANDNGVLDPGELRTETTADGVYWFKDLSVGGHVIREIVPTGFKQSFPPGGFYRFDLGPRDIIEGVDFGNAPLPGGEVLGAKWLDRDGDGARDANEPGIAGVTIYADLNGNGALDPGEPSTVSMKNNPDTASDETGLYRLSDVPAGPRMIREIVPEGHEQTFPQNGFHLVEVKTSGAVENIDFGNQPVPGAILGTKWQDDNGNGARDPNEPGLAGVTIYVDLNGNGILDADEPTAETTADNPATALDESGQYRIEGLEAGTYSVREIVPNGYRQTFPQDGRHIVEVLAGVATAGIDLGNQPLPGSVQGRKWQDDNGDGVHDSNEPGLPGVTIYLDVNGNGELDADEPATETTADDPVTDFDEGGLYRFDGLVTGTHTIREVVPDGHAQTFPQNGRHVVQVLPGAAVDDINFGNQPLPGSIQGTKWQDDNGDGARDTNEPGLPGVTVYLDLNSNGILDEGEPVTETSTDNSATGADEAGRYRFAAVDAGKYVVREVVPDGHAQTFPQGGQHEIEVLPGTAVEGIDFGNLPLPGSIDGSKWQDDNGDGERDPDEPGLPGVTIYVDLNGNGILDDDEPQTETRADDPETASDESGRYQFDGLRAGRYVIREIVPEGHAQTFPQENQHVVELAPGATIDGIDFGNLPLPGSIHGTKWQDDNGNGLRDANEPGLPGVTIYADLNGNGALDEGEPSTETMADDSDTAADESGRYWLDKLVAGTYAIREIVPNGHAQTFPQGGQHVIEISPGEVVEGMDFGNQPLQGSIHGTKWRDDNGDGVRDANEPGLPGVTIYADLNDNGALDQGEPAAVTMMDDPDTDFDESGLYWLDELDAGQYIIREVVPVEHTPTFPQDGRHLVEVLAGAAVQGIEFGNQPILPGSIHGTKWQDDNGDGLRDANEPGLAGVTIYADLNGNGLFDAGEPATTTMEDDPDTDFDESGLYWLDQLVAGRYVIREVVPTGHLQTFPQNGQHTVEVQMGTATEGIDFGNQPIRPGSIHGTKWQDDNGNGVRDPNESGLPGVTIYADLNVNGQLDTGEPATTTMADDPVTDFDESGLYWLDQLEAGSYVIREIVPDDHLQTFPLNGQHVVIVPMGTVVEGIDFGNQRLRRGSIHGLKWRDDNGDGMRGDSEPGYAGVTIYIDANDNGQLDEGEQRAITMADDQTTEFDESGRYWLEGLQPGTYVIREVVPEEFDQTLPAEGHYVVELSSGQTIDGVNFGNRSRFLPGDTDRDGTVAFADFLRLAASFGFEDKEWEDGDFNGDRRVQFRDFLELARNFGKSIPVVVGPAAPAAAAHDAVLASLSADDVTDDDDDLMDELAAAAEGEGDGARRSF